MTSDTARPIFSGDESSRVTTSCDHQQYRNLIINSSNCNIPGKHYAVTIAPLARMLPTMVNFFKCRRNIRTFSRNLRANAPPLLLLDMPRRPHRDDHAISLHPCDKVDAKLPQSLLQTEATKQLEEGQMSSARRVVSAWDGTVKNVTAPLLWRTREPLF